MKTIQDWYAFVVQQRLLGKNVNLDKIILDYVTRYQRVSSGEIANYVFKRIGEEYRSLEFKDYIHTTLKRLVKSNQVVSIGEQYTTPDLYNKMKR